MTRPVLESQTLTTFEPGAIVQPAEAFTLAGRVFVGVQTLFAQDEIAWDNGDPPSGAARDLERGMGRWHGPAPLHIECSLDVPGASTYRLGHDDVARVAPGAPSLRVGLRGLFYSPFPNEVAPLFAGPLTLRVLVQSALTGEVTSSQDSSFLPPANPPGFDALQGAPSVQQVLELPELAAGSYILWCRVEEVRATQVLPPDYLSVTGYGSVDAIPDQFRYVVGEGDDAVVYVWDWLRDVGMRPADPAQLALDGTAMYAAHQAAVLDGTLEHRGEWTQFIRDGAAHGCDWSALRVVVSDDEEAEWSVGAEVLPAPNAALQEIVFVGSNPVGRETVPFDPLARSITASCFESPSTCLPAGSIATSQGPALALWRLETSEDEISAELLGTHPNDQKFVCEQALLTNFASDVLVVPREDGTEDIYVLSLGRLHKWDRRAYERGDLANALPGVPVTMDGHPGGRALRRHPTDRELKYFTESFVQNLTQNGEVFFYNRLVEFGTEFGATQRATHAGTSFHGHNCAEVCWGDLLGVTMSGPYGGADVQAYIAALREGKWEKWGLEAFPASKYLWQRLRTVGTREGLRLLVCGRERDSEDALWAVDDAHELREAFLRFRPRRLTRTTWGTSGEALLCVGRAVADGVDGEPSVASAWSVLALGDLDGDGSLYVRKCLFWDETLQAFEISRAALEGAGFDVAKLPAYLWWEIDLGQNGGGVWLQKEAAPTDGRPYLEKSLTELQVLYGLPSGLAFPYSADVWSRICFVLHEDGGTGTDAIPPEPGCDNAACAHDLMPEGTKPIFITRPVGGTVWSAIQVSDVSELASDAPLAKLARVRLDWPNLWCRVDSSAPVTDLASYRQLLQFDVLQALSREAQARVDVCVLVPPGVGTIRTPAVDPRN